MEEIINKLNKINNKINNKIKNNDIVCNDSKVYINILLDDIDNELEHIINLQKKNVTEQDIIIISRYNKNKQFINNIFPLFHYLYENTLYDNNLNDNNLEDYYLEDNK